MVEEFVDEGEVVVVVKRQLVGEVVVVVQERVEVENVLNRVLSHGSRLIQGRTPSFPTSFLCGRWVDIADATWFSAC